MQEDFCEIEQIIKYNNSNICSSFLRETKLCLQFWTCILHKVYDKDIKRSECYLNAMHQTQTSIQIWNGTLHTRTEGHTCCFPAVKVDYYITFVSA